MARPKKDFSIKDKFNDEFPETESTVEQKEVMVDDVVLDNQSTIDQIPEGARTLELRPDENPVKKRAKKEEKEFNSALILEDFSVHVPMPAQHKVFTIVNFYKGKKINDPYLLSFIKDGNHPIQLI